MPRRLPIRNIRSLQDWHEAYQEWAQRPDVRRLVRPDLGGVYSFGEIIPIYDTRGSIYEQYNDDEPEGHWYTFFPDGDDYILYDPSFPSGEYYNPDRRHEILSTVADMMQIPLPHVRFYEPQPFPLQNHVMDTFCQTWSMVAVAGGEWQGRQTYLESINNNQLRLDLLYEFITHWLSLDSSPTARNLQQWLQSRNRSWFDHYYSANDMVHGRRLFH